MPAKDGANIISSNTEPTSEASAIPVLSVIKQKQAGEQPITLWKYIMKQLSTDNMSVSSVIMSLSPMMFMPDAIRGTIELMESDAANVKVRSSYNLSAINFNPAEVTCSIQKHIPDFKVCV